MSLQVPQIDAYQLPNTTFTVLTHGKGSHWGSSCTPAGPDLLLPLHREKGLELAARQSAPSFASKQADLHHPAFLLPLQKQLKIFNLFVKIFNVILTVHQLFKSS